MRLKTIHLKPNECPRSVLSTALASFYVMQKQNLLGGFCGVGLLFFISGCIGGNQTTGSVALNSQSLTPTVPSGEKAVKVLFRESAAGSFDPAPSAGTVPGIGTGHPALRYFKPDGASAATPPWIQRIEVGISGPSNTSSPDPGCARFIASSAAQCDCNNDGALDQPCGGPVSVYGISEYDCTNPLQPTTGGTGGFSDGVYVRIKLNRKNGSLGSNENLLIGLEYEASQIHAAPVNPSQCFTGGIFNPTNPGCSDMSWQFFLTGPNTPATAAFMTFIPPALSFVDTNLGKCGGGVSSRQVIIPLAALPDVDTVQLSRMRALDHQPPFSTICSSGSPLCLGFILHTMSLTRI